MSFGVRTVAWLGLLLAFSAGAQRGAAAPHNDAETPSASARDAAALCERARALSRQADETAAADPVEARRLYASAALTYESVARDTGVRNGQLYYNIGNAWFGAGDLGRAILNYRLAELYAPDDPNLRHNLAYARRQRIDEIPASQKAQALRALFFWHYDLPAPGRAMLFALLYLAAWGCAAWRLFARRPEPLWGALVCGTLAALLAGSLVVGELHAARVREGVILAPEVVARKGDSASYQPAFTEPLHAGTEFTLVETRERWMQIELNDSRRCWIPAEAAGLAQ